MLTFLADGMVVAGASEAVGDRYLRGPRVCWTLGTTKRRRATVLRGGVEESFYENGLSRDARVESIKI